MKKTQLKRYGHGYAKHKDLLKPFDFCCNVNRQDPETRYDMRIPPLVTSLTNIAPKNTEGPDLKFRLQDIGKPAIPTLRGGSHKVKKTHAWRASGSRRGKVRGRGPLRWYLEDEIALAREIIANEKVEKRKREKKHRRDKARKKRRRSKKRKSSGVGDNRDADDRKDVDKEE